MSIGLVRGLLALGASAILATPLAHAQEPADSIAAAIEVREIGEPFRLELIGNFSRLPAFVGVRDSEDLAAKRADPTYARQLARTLEAKYPYARRARVGNLFIGYSCAGMNFREIARRDASGALRFDFDEVIGMLDLVVAAGFKPVLALTGTPAALVPAGEAPANDKVYGCVNAPTLDWSSNSARQRAKDWWDLQHAFFDALLKHYGAAELKQWEFATWTEPYNPRGSAHPHLLFSPARVPAARYEDAVATVIAASIDAAMASGLQIHIGNFAGDILSGYPRVIEAIRRMDRGPEYLSYVTGYAVSRYRTQPRMNIASMVRDAARLQEDERMPKKPLFVDEIGELVDDTGAAPPKGAPGLESAAFIAPAMHEVFKSQLSGRPGIQRLAIWDPTIASRHAAALAGAQPVMASAMQNVISMYSRLSGLRAVAVRGGKLPLLAAKTSEGLYVVASAPADGQLCAPDAQVVAPVRIRGLRPGARYSVLIRTVGPRSGNPMSAFLGDQASYLCDRTHFVQQQRRWEFSSPREERCFFEDGQACTWRQSAVARAAPEEQRLQLVADEKGVASLRLTLSPGASASAEIADAGK